MKKEIFNEKHLENNKKKNVLFVATVTSHINAFHIPYLKWFKEQGYEVHVASKGNEKIEYCDRHFNLPFERFPFKSNNIKAYKELKKIIDNNKYDIIHCHTPVGGVLTRLSARKARKKGTKVLYTAHGFHFFKGAPLLNWLIYYPVEKICARWTDCLITINEEDYQLAKKKLNKAKQIEYVHGVGVNSAEFKKGILNNEKKEQLRKSLGINKDDFVIIYPAELSNRKNQGMLIRAIKLIHEEKRKKIKVLLPGKDSKNGEYQQLANSLGVSEQILFLGFRNDIADLLQISDLEVSTSKQEGLPVNIMETMFSGVPIIATNCRGNRDIVDNLVEIGEDELLSQKIEDAMINKQKYICKINEKYELKNVMSEMEKIYRQL